MPSRRAFLAGATGLVVAGVVGTGIAVEDGVLPGRPWAYRHLGLDGSAGIVPDIASGKTVSGSFTSRLRGGVRTGWMIAYPPAATPGAALPVVVALHGLNGDHTSSFGTGLHLDKYLAQAHQRGTPAFAVASVDGGNSYWHKRASGEDAGAMLTQEFLPLLASKGLDTSRLGFLGYSMGGYSALLLAQTLQSDKVRAVAAESPALWRHPGDTAPGAFDDPADYYAHNVFGHQASLAGIAVQVDCGTGDGFYPCAKAYADGFAVHPAGGFAPGAHDMAYWHRMAPAQLAFLGAHL